MKICINPMPVLQEKAEAAIDTHFNGLAAANAQKDQEYALKRTIAYNVLSDPSYVAPAAFALEAELMGLSTPELAQSISGKADLVLERGLARRTAILSVRAAQSPDAVDAVLSRYGIPMFKNIHQGG